LAKFESAAWYHPEVVLCEVVPDVAVTEEQGGDEPVIPTASE
jgi:hypothetical protein